MVVTNCKGTCRDQIRDLVARSKVMVGSGGITKGSCPVPGSNGDYEAGLPWIPSGHEVKRGGARGATAAVRRACARAHVRRVPEGERAVEREDSRGRRRCGD